MFEPTEYEALISISTSLIAKIDAIRYTQDTENDNILTRSEVIAYLFEMVEKNSENEVFKDIVDRYKE